MLRGGICRNRGEVGYVGAVERWDNVGKVERWDMLERRRIGICRSGGEVGFVGKVEGNVASGGRIEE
jgi:hypothetical protein